MNERTPPQHATIIDALEARSSDATLRIERGMHGERRVLSPDEIIGRSRRTAAGLREAGLESGDVCALLLPTCPEFVFSCFGAWYAGGVPTVLPLSFPKDERTVERIRVILDRTDPAVLVTDDFIWSQIADDVELPGKTTLTDIDELLETDRTIDPTPPTPEQAAFIQFTSGTTGEPKGVVIEHDQLAANIRASGKRSGYQSSDRLVSWIPMFHDLGLVAGFLSGVYWNLSTTLIPTERFIGDPSCWLEAMAEQRGTISQAPTFAFDLVAARMADRANTLDLSQVRTMLVCAEPIFKKTITRFVATFEPAELDETAMMAGYGLAEATLGVCSTAFEKAPTYDWVDRNVIRESGVAEPLEPSRPRAIPVTNLGQAIDDIEISIQDNDGQHLDPRRVGEVCLRGPFVANRYLDESISRDEDGWFHTGDLGYLTSGELHVTGRQKDLIIRGGRNIHPTRLERAAGEVDSVRTGRVVAFGEVDLDDQIDRTVVVVEPGSDAAAEAEIQRRVRRRTQSETGVQVDEVFVAERGFVPKTTSGKLRRTKCREMYRDATE